MKTDATPATLETRAPRGDLHASTHHREMTSRDSDMESRSPHSGQPATLPQPAWKRAVDLLLIVCSLPVLVPVVLLASLWIRIGSRGPILFRQKRIGHEGEEFTIYKFRSMKNCASTSVHTDHVRELMRSDCEMVKLDKIGDPRLIPGGALLRMSGLDEVPQLLNVLRGEMSIVGPRPCLPEEYEMYSAAERERFAVLPGLTGYWQVKGKNRTRFSEMVDMDIHYVRKRSLPLDLFIMLATPWALVKQIFETSQPRPVREMDQAPEGEEGEQGVTNAHC